jgi:hypothetical protein
VNVTHRLARLRSRGQTYGFLIGVVVTMLVGALLIPFTLGDRPSTLAARGTGDDFGAIDAAPPTSAPDGAAPATDGADGAPVVAVEGAAGGGGAEGRTGGGGRTAGVPGSGAGTAGGGASGGGSAAGTSDGAAAAQAAGRTASDQGVTPETIRLGVLLTDLGGTAALGFDTSDNGPDEQKKYFQDHIDHINRNGGLGGRKIEPFYEVVDILSQDSMRAACRTLAVDRKVFAVVHILGVYGDPILCFTEQQKLPYVAWDGAVADYYPRSNGLLFTAQPSTRRTSLDMARRLHELGELKGKKVGVLRYAEYLDADMTALLDYTRSLGITVVDAVISVSNVGAVPGQLSVAVNRFQSEGVQQVFLMTNTLYAQQFVSQAERQQFRPAYAVSDFDYASAGDSFLGDMPDSFFDRGLLVTSTRIGDREVSQPVDAECGELASQFLQRPVKPGDDGFYEYLAPCGLLKILRLGVEGAGTNPTRRAFSDALQRTGSFPNAGFSPSSFGPGKFGGPDQVRVVQANLGCRCWKVAGTFGPTGFRGS